MVDWHLQPKYLLEKKSEKLDQDQNCATDNLCSCEAATNQSDKLNQLEYRTYQRYYHVFCSGELSKLFEAHVSSAHVEEEYYDRDNWCVIATKI